MGKKIRFNDGTYFDEETGEFGGGPVPVINPNPRPVINYNPRPVINYNPRPVIRTPPQSYWKKIASILLIIGIISGIIYKVVNSNFGSETKITSSTNPDTNITIPNDMNTITERQYAGRLLTGVTFNAPSIVTSIGNSAFRDNQLTSITIPDSVKTIGQDAFHGNRLTGITIPDSVKTIGTNAFAGNPVTSVTIGANVTLNWSGNIGILGQNTGFNGAYENNNNKAGTYTRINTSTTEWMFAGQVIRPQTTQRQTSTPAASTNRLIPNPANPYFINDFANVLSNGTKNHINERSQRLLKEKNIQMIFTTITSTENLSLEDYSLQMWNAWKIGNASNNNAVLFIIRIIPNRWDWQLRWGYGNSIANVGGENILYTIRRYDNMYFSIEMYDEGIKVIYDAIYDMF